MPQDPTQLDPKIVKVMGAIKKIESGGDYNAVGDGGQSHGAYQWNKDNFKSQAADFGLDPNDMSPANQNKVAYARIKSLKDQGRQPEEIAAIWNGAKKLPNGSFTYINPQYGDKFRTALQQKSQGATQQNGYQPPAQPGAQQQTPTGGGNDYAPPTPPTSQGTTNVPPPEPPKSFMQKAGDVAGKVGDFLFPVAGDISSALQGKGNGKTALQVAGDIGSSALSAATLIPGLGAGALAAKAGLMGTEALGEGINVASKVAPTLMGTIGKNAVLGAGFGVSGALGAGQTDPGQIAQSTAIGGLTGGVLGGAGKLASDKLASMAGATAESRLTSQTGRLKTLSKSFADNSRPASATSAATDPITTLSTTMDGTTKNPLIKGLKVVGSKVNADELTNMNGTGTIDNLLEEHSSQATKLVKSLQGGVTIDKYQEDVLKAIASNPEIRDAGGVSKATAEVKRIFADYKASFGDQMTYENVDNIRARMNKIYDPTERDVARTIGDTARSYLYNGDASNVALRSAMQNESELIRAKNFVEKLNGTTVPGGQLGKYFADLIGAGAGASLGNMLGGPLGGTVGTVAGGALTHKIGGVIQGNYFNPMLGKSTGALQNLLKSKTGQAIKGTAKAGLLRGASSL